MAWKRGKGRESESTHTQKHVLRKGIPCFETQFVQQLSNGFAARRLVLWSGVKRYADYMPILYLSLFRSQTPCIIQYFDILWGEDDRKERDMQWRNRRHKHSHAHLVISIIKYTKQTHKKEEHVFWTHSFGRTDSSSWQTESFVLFVDVTTNFLI